MNPSDRNLRAVTLPPNWAPESWRSRQAVQMPTYPDAEALESALGELRQLPPLVTSWEIFSLKKQLAEAQEGKRFLLQGGDCAESFSDCESGLISNRLKVLLQMSLVLVHGLRLPVVRVAQDGPRDAVFALRVCRVWARRQGYTGPYVFYGVQARTREGTWTYAALNRQLHLAAERAGVRRIMYRAMHSLRRMAGGNVLAATGDITKVGDWLGDTDMRVLKKSYLRARPEGLATVVATTKLPPREKQPASKTGNKMATAPTRGAAEETVSR